MRDTIEMAREAGFERVIGVNQKTGIQTIEAYANDSLQRFEALIRADEREACAKLCDDIDDSHWGCEVKASWCSREIRARGETK
jgi:hypothetical protein